MVDDEETAGTVNREAVLSLSVTPPRSTGPKIKFPVSLSLCLSVSLSLSVCVCVCFGFSDNEWPRVQGWPILQDTEEARTTLGQAFMPLQVHGVTMESTNITTR